jgi:hypothetical protein
VACSGFSSYIFVSSGFGSAICICGNFINYNLESLVFGFESPTKGNFGNFWAKVPGCLQNKLNKKSEREIGVFFQSFSGWLWVVVRFRLELP